MERRVFLYIRQRIYFQWFLYRVYRFYTALVALTLHCVLYSVWYKLFL